MNFKKEKDTGALSRRSRFTPRICDSCLARKNLASCPSMNYRNFGESAAYPLTVLSHEQYLAIEADVGQVSDWSVMQGWRLENTMFDFMHCVYLGIGRDLVGSGLRTLIDHGVYGRVLENGINRVLSVVHEEMRQDCKSHGLYLPSKPVLSVTAICDDDGYAMLGSRYKACHCKIMIWWLSFKLAAVSEAFPDDACAATETFRQKPLKFRF